MSFTCLKMFGLPSNVVFLWYLCENKNIHCGMHIFFRKFSKNDRFLPKMTKIIGFQAKIEKTRFYTIWEPCFIYKCDFWPNWPSRGVLQTLCGNFSYFVILAHFWSRKMEKMAKNPKFWTFWGSKWVKMAKKWKIPHNDCKTPLEAQFDQKSHL